MQPSTPLAAAVLDRLDAMVARATGELAERVDAEDEQVLLYDLSHAAASLAVARHAIEQASPGDEQHLADVFAAETARTIVGRTFGHEAVWAVEADDLTLAREFVTAAGSPAALAAAADAQPTSHLDDSFALVAETFRKFGEDVIWPQAEHVHRHDLDVPEDIIEGLSELGCFGLSVREEYGGFATGSPDDMLGMVIATEELSRAALAIGGSLITRPEILARAIEAGGTEAQKLDWLPRLASGEIMAAVAVTEPDHGSDVAGLKVSARPGDDGIYRINGVKTWCTFAGRADVLMVLARTEDDATHRGLSLFVVPKPRAAGHDFSFEQAGGGKMSGRAIATLGYRGMHSFEVSFEDWAVEAEHLIGGENGRGRGFYLQMAGFENGRLQTAARAVGVMQRALEEAQQYASDRKVFGQPLAAYELTQVKLGLMSATIWAARLYNYEVARLMATGEGTLEAAMAKAFSTRVAEWVTREAMQIHGGFGYAEEYPVSRLFVDARVLSIFEGADETLCLKLIGRRLLAQARS